MKGVVEASLPDGQGPAIELNYGDTFKSTITEKIYHVGWMGSGWVWLVTADSRYGLLCPEDSDFLKYTKPSSAKAGSPGNNAKGWQKGDKITGLRSLRFEIIATGDKCVLLHGDELNLPFAVPNDDMEQYYKKAAYDSGLFD